jgi:inorganic pyrophosphatase
VPDQKFEHSSVIECGPIGMVEYFEDGQADHKIFMIPVKESGEVTAEVKERLLDFNANYFKGQPNKKTQVGDFLGKEDATKEIGKSKV